MADSLTNPHCFPPLAGGRERVLILGSFPGRLSLEKGCYYAHPRNSFWPIMGQLFSFDPQLPYAQRVAHLARNRVAVWDVLASCSRTGSLDSSIKNKSIKINDLLTFLEKNRLLHTIFFNGALAERLYLRSMLHDPGSRSRPLSLHRLPSTSPAMATLTFSQKLQAWSRVHEAATARSIRHSG